MLRLRRNRVKPTREPKTRRRFSKKSSSRKTNPKSTESSVSSTETTTPPPSDFKKDDSCLQLSALCQSLCVGTISSEGLVCFTPTDMNNNSIVLPPSSYRFLRSKSSFLRVADLELTSLESSSSTVLDEEEHPNFHHAAVDPPPGVDHDPREMWVALDDGAGSHAPIAPQAMQALAKIGFDTAMDQSMWTIEPKYAKLLKQAQDSWFHHTFDETGFDKLQSSKDVVVWSGAFQHGGYGSELPAIRAAGVVGMSAQALMELLVDSTRVKEYNQLSLGRQDLLVLQDDMEQDGPFGYAVTKVMRSETRPPMLRKTMEFISILHAHALDNGDYLVVTRAVTHPHSWGAEFLRSEILMGVNLIRAMPNQECLMINVNHIRSPGLPLMLAKRVGVTAAANFIHDLQALAVQHSS